MENKIYVKAPIRYGKKSRHDIVTMVFSNKMKNKKGICYIVPFKKLVNNIDELLCEALAFSSAEGMEGKFLKNWAVLTYLFNDSLINSDIKNEIVRLFRRRKDIDLRENDIHFDINKYKLVREKNCITKSLKLDIDWPEPLLKDDRNMLNEFHFLLATAPKPEIPPIKISDIAEKVKSDNVRRYFINNLMNGIITTEDFEISKGIYNKP